MPATAKAPRTLRVRMSECGLRGPRDLSAKSGLIEVTVGKLARGYVPSKPEAVQKVAKALGCTAAEVLESILESGREEAVRLGAML